MKYDLAVVGGGSGGLTVAAAAAQFGRKVVLFEKGMMGGDCLNYGCVPSKALIAAAKHAASVREGPRFGVTCREPEIDFTKVRAHIQRVIAAIEPNDSEERFERLGVKVVRAAARFVDGTSLEADGEIIQARRIVIATGSRAAIPPIPGLDVVPYFTNETIFDNPRLPRHLIIIGGGPIGIELAQAYGRLGSEVTVLEAMEPLGREDPELSAVVLKRFVTEGINIRAHTKISQIKKSQKGISVEITDGAKIEGSHLLVAAGRAANVESLNLEAAGIAYTNKGITVDKGLRTSNRKVYAIGDVVGGAQFTHLAAHHAGLVIRNALFGLPIDKDAAVIPRVTFTDPELAQVGLDEKEARKLHDGDVTVLSFPFEHNDRAQAEGRTEGLVKAIVGRRGRILGAGIAGHGAGELILPWVLAMSNNLPVKALVNSVFPYPTFGEAGRKAALNYFSPLATNRWVRRVIEVVGLAG